MVIVSFASSTCKCHSKAFPIACPMKAVFGGYTSIMRYDQMQAHELLAAGG